MSESSSERLLLLLPNAKGNIAGQCPPIRPAGNEGGCPDELVDIGQILATKLLASFIVGFLHRGGTDHNCILRSNLSPCTCDSSSIAALTYNITYVISGTCQMCAGAA